MAATVAMATGATRVTESSTPPEIPAKSASQWGLGAMSRKRTIGSDTLPPPCYTRAAVVTTQVSEQVITFCALWGPGRWPTALPGRLLRS